MIAGDLTTLGNVKAWLGVSTSSDDALLARLISAQSRLLQTWLNRRIAAQTYTEVRDGSGMGRGRFEVMFNNAPVSSVVSLAVNGVTVAASSDGGVLQPGYGFDADSLWLAPTTPALNTFAPAGFVRGKGNVKLQYVGGFLVMPTTSVALDDPGLLPGEQQTVPNAANYALSTNFTWLSDNGVTYASSGAAFARVGASPGVGQYTVADGTYEFNVADAGQPVLLSYSFAPPDLEQACIELIGMRYKEKDRIGQVSKSIGTETIMFSQKDMPADVLTTLQQYKRVFAF